MSPITEEITNATDNGRMLVSGTRFINGRAMNIRSTNSPIATITDRNITQRAISTLGEVAV